MRWVAPLLRGVFVGSGSDGLAEPAVCRAILALTDKAGAPSQVKVAYIGAATYDLPGPAARQTARFREAGCEVVEIIVGNRQPRQDVDVTTAVRTIDSADVVVVGGGNTLFAIERLKYLGLDAALRRAMERGCVLAGGSAGAICWFDSGHSDSMDPDTYIESMIRAASTAASASPKDESSIASTDEKKPWQYIRVAGLGFLPGMLGPHYDRVQSNGVPRSEDFAAMLRRHPGEIGIGIDHWAALVVRDGHFEVLSVPGKVRGSSGHDQADGELPAVWVLSTSAVGGVCGITKLPPTGELAEYLRPATELRTDPLEAQCITENPPFPSPEAASSPS